MKRPRVYLIPMAYYAGLDGASAPMTGQLTAEVTEVGLAASRQGTQPKSLQLEQHGPILVLKIVGLCGTLSSV
jgi:hypothetical protein